MTRAYLRGLGLKVWRTEAQELGFKVSAFHATVLDR